MKILVVYYSMYGHVHQMALAAAEGVREKGAEALLRRVPETLPETVLEKMGALQAQKEMGDVPVARIEELAEADGFLLGTPTRFGNMCGQMRQFLDAAGQLWARGALVGKPAGAFVSTGTQHGGQETTLTSTHLTLLHLGCVVVGLPYSFAGQMDVSAISGGSPYGAGTIAGPDGSRRPGENDLAGARFLGRHLAGIAARLSASSP